MTGSQKVLYIRHDSDAHQGVIGSRLAERGFEAEELFIVQTMDNRNPTVEFGDPSRYDLIVPLGAIYSVYDTAMIGNWVKPELEFLAEAHSRDIPILGVCFGGQALALALDGVVEKAPVPEIGWCPIESDHPDDLATGPWMQWHYDRFEIPPGATEVARSEASSQAFRIGRSLGLQFHPEVTTEIVHSWLDGAPAEELNKPGIDVPAIRADSDRLAPLAKPRTERLVDWFLDDIAKL